MSIKLFGAATASLALGQQVVLQAPGKSYTLRMRAAGDAPVTATDAGCAPVIHLAVVDVGPRADISSRPALVGIRKALAPAAGALGSAEAGGGGGGWAVERTIIERQRCGLGIGIEAFLRIGTSRSEGSCLCVAVAAATQALVDVAARGLRALGRVAYAGTKFIRAAQTSKSGHGACRRPSPVLEV